MLHKKSEYRLQYNKLDKELRRQIWQDNISLRKSRLMSNQATHYWEYQLRDEVCDCGNGDDDDDGDDGGPLPPHRQKHKHLREQYKNQVGKVKTNDSSRHKDGCAIAVQTPEWNGDEPDNRVSSLDDASEPELARHMSSLTLPEVKDSSSSSRPRTPTPHKVPPTPHVCPRTAATPRPTRTSRKLLADGKKTHFVPFGWNEANTDVGHKQTYNVCAPEKEVHDSARTAAQRRKAEINLFLAQEKKVKHQTRPRERTTSSNSSNMWVSEYREQFSARSCRSTRPLSAPPAPRQPVSWRHS